MKKDIIYTKHAEDMLVERGFSKELIEDVVLSPDERREGEEDLWHAIREIEGKYLRVVVLG